MEFYWRLAKYSCPAGSVNRAWKTENHLYPPRLPRYKRGTPLSHFPFLYWHSSQRRQKRHRILNRDGQVYGLLMTSNVCGIVGERAQGEGVLIDILVFEQQFTTKVSAADVTAPGC
jgi:hypothetical protein